MGTDDRSLPATSDARCGSAIRTRGLAAHCLAAVMVTAPLIAQVADSETNAKRNHANVRVEKTRIEGGAELVTVFIALKAQQSIRYKEMPVVTVLRDTLGNADAKSARLRDVWLLTAGTPSAMHRIASTLPFLYLVHTPQRSRSPNPIRLLDFGDPARQTETALIGALVQANLLDRAGTALRTVSRSYRMNDMDDSVARAAEGMAAMSDAEQDPDTPADTVSDLARLHERLLLSDAMLGGLVREQNLLSYNDRQRTERTIARGHNWELVRQAAEAGGLYFDPLSFDGNEPAYAMCWIRRQDLRHAPAHFDGKLLHIANPYRSRRVTDWRGYTEQWLFDGSGRHVTVNVPAATESEVIPLALYSLDHPRVPLLLVSFQDSGKPRLRESIGQAAEDITQGVLGLSPMTHLEYFIGQAIVTFVRRRHGEATQRFARVRSWVELSYALSMTGEIGPGLRDALVHNVHAPVFEGQSETVDDKAKLAWERYRRLTGSDSPVPCMLDRRRHAELAILRHRPLTRFAFAMARLSTLRVYDHQENTDGMYDELDWARRMKWNRDFLDEVVRSSPQPEVTWDPDRIRSSLAEVSRLAAARRVSHDEISRTLARLAQSTADGGIRILTLETLAAIRSGESLRQLATLSQQSDSAECLVCGYHARDYAEKAPAAALMNEQ